MFLMMQSLQKECDRQARKIIEHFKKARDFDQKVSYVSFVLFKCQFVYMCLRLWFLHQSSIDLSVDRYMVFNRVSCIRKLVL